MLAPATDDVVALFKLGEEVGDLVGIVLEIAVHGEDEVTLGVVEACGECGGLTEVAAELDDENAAIDGGDLFQQAVGAVAGSIVDEHQLKGFADLLHYGLQTVVECGDVFFFVMERNDDGIFRHGFNDTPVGTFPCWTNDEENNTVEEFMSFRGELRAAESEIVISVSCLVANGRCRGGDKRCRGGP